MVKCLKAKQQSRLSELLAGYDHDIDLAYRWRVGAGLRGSFTRIIRTNDLRVLGGIGSDNLRCTFGAALIAR